MLLIRDLSALGARGRSAVACGENQAGTWNLATVTRVGRCLIDTADLSRGSWKETHLGVHQRRM